MGGLGFARGLKIAVLCTGTMFWGACDDPEQGSGSDGAGTEGGTDADTAGTPSTATTTGSDGDPTGTPSSTSDASTTGASDSTDTATDPTETSGTTGDLVDAEKIELRVNDYLVPTDETTYACFEFTLTFDQLSHIVGFAPFIDNGAHVHHFVVTQLNQPSGNGDGYSCFDLAGDMIWAWAPGQTEFILPDEAGFLVGNAPDGETHLRVQVHYNNPMGVDDARDSSGLDIFVTPNLRPNRAGTLVVGDISSISIPPGQEAHEHVATCQSAVTSFAFEGPINVFGTTMHAHELGSVLYTEVWRDGQLAFELNRDDPYLFDSQHIKYVDRVLEPGDEIRNHCFYDSTSRDTTTEGGTATRDEMCWNTMMYYPKISTGFDYCGVL